MKDLFGIPVPRSTQVLDEVGVRFADDRRAFLRVVFPMGLSLVGSCAALIIWAQTLGPHVKDAALMRQVTIAAGIISIATFVFAMIARRRIVRRQRIATLRDAPAYRAQIRERTTIRDRQRLTVTWQRPEHACSAHCWLDADADTGAVGAEITVLAPAGRRMVLVQVGDVLVDGIRVA